MARQGLTYEQVAAVADILVAEQVKPTLSALRERLGSGSMNTIHRHFTAWQGKQKPSPRKLSEPNPRLLSALGAELSKVAEEASADAHAELQSALSELAALAANGEALEAERDELSKQLADTATERDTLAGKANEQAAEIERLKEQADRQSAELARARRELAQAELRLEAVPRLERELGDLRAQIVDEQARRTAAEMAAAVADATRAGAETARDRAESRLESAEIREAETRKELATAHTTHEATRRQLTEAVGQAAGAVAEVRELRAQLEAIPGAPSQESATELGTDLTGSRQPAARRKR